MMQIEQVLFQFLPTGGFLMKKFLFLALSCIVLAQQSAHAMNLVEAVRSGDVTRVTELLNLPGTDVNQTDNDFTALDWAVLNGDEAMARLLLEHGAAVDPQDKIVGYTPLHYAASYGYVAIVRLLLENGADINKTNYRGMTPLQAAFDRKKMYGAVPPSQFEAVVRLLQEWPAELAKRAEAKRKAGLAISTGLHPRAGAASTVRHVDPANIQQIMGYVKPVDYTTPETEE